jgi:NitT/TauT family transport system permease protein
MYAVAHRRDDQSVTKHEQASHPDTAAADAALSSQNDASAGVAPDALDVPARESAMSRIRLQAIVLTVVTVAVIGLWQAFVEVFDMSEFVLPGPWAIAKSFDGNWGQLWDNMIPTFHEALLGYAIGNAIGILTAALIAEFRVLEIGLYPYIIAFRSLPVISVVPLLIIWMGFTIWPIVGSAVLIVFFPTFVNAVDGFKATDETTLELMRGLNASRWQTFWYVKWRNALPYMFAALKISIASALVGAVVGEWIIGQKGLGYLTILANNYVDTLLLFRALFGLSIIAIVWFVIVRALEAHFLKWQRAARS